MSTESETKSAGVPAGATHEFEPAWFNDTGQSVYCSECGRHKDLHPQSAPIAEAGPAPTTAAPAELPNRREFHASTPAEFAAAAKVAQGGDTIIVPDWPLPRAAAPAEQLSGKVCPHGIRWPWECKDCLYAAEQPGKADEGDHADDCTDPNCHKRHTIPAGKAADPRPVTTQSMMREFNRLPDAQPQAPVKQWRSPNLGLTIRQVLLEAASSMKATDGLSDDLHAAYADIREHPPEVAAPLREERDRLAAAVEQLAGDVQAAAEDYTDERAKVAERDARIATLEQASWSFAEWAERAQCFGCDVEFSEDPEPDDTQPCECCESIRRSYRLVIAAIGRERVQSLRGRAALGAPEGQPSDYDPMTSPVPEGDMNGPHGPIPAPEGQPPAAPSEAPRRCRNCEEPMSDTCEECQ